MEYWWEGSVSPAIPSTSTSVVVSQHHKIGGIAFGTIKAIQAETENLPERNQRFLRKPSLQFQTPPPANALKISLICYAALLNKK